MSSVETVTILITDLVGSTRLELEAGPGLAHQLRIEHFTLLREAVDEFGGHTVKTTGDGLMAAFPSASAAIDCARSMQQRCERRNRASDHAMRVRIGIGAGEASVEEGDYFGLPPIHAARLCEAADHDAILVSGLVQALAGARVAGLEPLGERRLKGIDEPVAVFRVPWRPLGFARPDAVPLPPALHAAAAEGFVGRVDERALIVGLLAEAVEQAGRRVAMICGEPGIGKTRLATQVALGAHATGWCVLWGAAIEDLGGGYAPWIQALSHLVEHLPARSLRAHVERSGGELARLVPMLSARTGAPPPAAAGVDPASERFRMFSAAADLLGAASEQFPIMLVLDDLHWADGESLALLRYLVTVSETWPLLVVGTFRDSDLTRDHPLVALLADTHRAGGVHRLALGGLRVDDVAAIMETAVDGGGGAVGLQLAAEITGETGGNPFYAAELLRHLQETGALTEASDGGPGLQRSIAELGQPQSVREVIERRVRRLGEDTERLLTAAAVIGPAFAAQLSAHVAGLDEEHACELLEAAEQASLVRESTDHPGQFGFVHALIPHALYDGLAPGRRSRWHRRVAQALEDRRGADPGDQLSPLAHHWARTERAEDAERAIEYAQLAAERALEDLAPDEAAGWLATAVELAERHGMGADPGLLLLLGDARQRTGDPTARPTLLAAAAAARDAGDSQLLAQVALRFGSFALSPGFVDDDLVGLLDEAIKALPMRDDPVLVRLLTRMAVALYFAPDSGAREQLVSEAIAMAERLKDPDALAFALARGALATRSPATTDRSVAWTRQALALEPASLELVLSARSVLIDLLLESDDLAGAHAEMAVLETMAGELRDPRAAGYAPLHRARLYMITGEFEEARRLNAVAARMGERLQDTTIPMLATAQRLSLRQRREDLRGIEAPTRAFVKAAPALPSWRAALALLLCDLGRDDEARAELDRLTVKGLQALSQDGQWLISMALIADACARLEYAAPANELCELLTPLQRRNVVSFGGAFLGPLTRYLGQAHALARRWDDAHENFDAARDWAVRRGSPHMKAAVDLDEAVMLDRRGEPEDRRRALELLAAAREAATSEMELLRDRVDELERHLGSAPSTATPAQVSLRRG